MRALKGALLGLLVVGVAAAGCVDPMQSAPIVGAKAPEFQLIDLEGHVVGVNATPGRVVLVDFMGSNCETCRLSMSRAMLDLHARWAADARISFLSVDVGSHDPSLGGRNEQELRDFRDGFGANWSFAMDSPDVKAAVAYEVIALPTVYVIDANGTVAFKHAGVAQLDCYDDALEHVTTHGYDGTRLAC
jgi:thiol-disulfide isomerase/thioredoxin